ncbi:MAG TPA: DUF1579 family protein [Blastocatellia bacterium]|nr:DUF1579 family protein [Blastocatellia bacterium]
MKAAVVLIGMLIMMAGAGLAQQPSRTPGPEHRKLGYFIGKWHGEGELKPGPFGPGGKFTENEDVQWMPGGFFLLIHSDESSPIGDGKNLMIMGYDADQRAYTFNAFDSSGEAESATGTLEGGTWTWTSDIKMGGKVAKSRFTMKELSPTAYSTKFEMSSDGGTTWMTIMEGKTTKL